MTLDDLLTRRESVDFEAKLAQGADGRGAVPRSLWETYSAMANTQGGDIVLGVEERRDGSFEVRGIDALHRVVKSFWDEVNNPRTVSANILRDADLSEVVWDGRTVLHLRVPRAERRQRPIYVGENPLTGTYRRNYEGDYKCPPTEARRLIADSEHETLDDRILEGFGFDDLDPDSLSSFRNEFRSASPGHVFLTYDDPRLLEQLGGWRRDRTTGVSGLTLAGLLMFGRFRPIHEALPHYVLDYQDVADLAPGDRWADRVTTDGTWPGNLYGFYRRAYARLTDDLRVPFRTERGQRVDETPVHRALKEALVNALIHADFSGTTPIRVLKERGGFSFRNPGTLRLPPAVALAGGLSDCRNRSLQKMFQMIGSAEQAGSGFPTIQHAWQEQHWRPLSLAEHAEPDHVTLRLSTTSLFPEPVLSQLQHRFGTAFSALSEPERIAVVTAAVEGRVANGRLQELLDQHPADLTKILQGLVVARFLVPHKRNRWAFYTIPSHPEGQSAFDFEEPNTEESGSNTEESGSNTEESGSNTEESGSNTGGSQVNLSTDEEDLQALGRTPLPDVTALLAHARTTRPAAWAPAPIVEESVLSLLRWARNNDTYLTSSQLAHLLERTVGTVRGYLNPLLESEKVVTRYAGRRAPAQGYQAAPGA